MSLKNKNLYISVYILVYWHIWLNNMLFNTDYNHPMDREYNPINTSYSPSAPLGAQEEEMPTLPTESKAPFGEELGVKDIGMSVPLGISAANVEGVAAKLRSGVVNLELGMAGTMHGNRQAQTPEMYGKDQRQALREVAKVNKVTFTTHAAYGIMGLMGQDQQGNFALTNAMAARKEVERAVDFAADVAGGGSVVVHTGEFERPVSNIYPLIEPDKEKGTVVGHLYDDKGNRMRNWAQDEKTGRLLFKKRQTEAGDFAYQLLDDRTGQMFSTVQADRLAAQPIWRRAKKDYWGINPEGKKVFIKKGHYIDYENRLIGDPYDIKFEKKHMLPEGYKIVSKGGRVPEYDFKSGRFKTHLMSIHDFEEEAKEYNKYYGKVMGNKPGYYQKMSGKEMFLKSTLTTQAGHSRGWALQYGHEVKREMDALEKLKKLRNTYAKIDKQIPQEEKWKILKQDTTLASISHGLLPPENKNPVKFIDEQIDLTRKRLEFAQQASASQEMQAEDTIETMRHLCTPEKHLENHTAKEYAMAAMRAYERTKDPNNPVVLTLENIFPERFGGHPQELKSLVKVARRKMVDYLTKEKVFWTGTDGNAEERFGKGPYDRKVNLPGPNPYYRKGMSKEEAGKIAERHIKATFDTGHANMWRKFYIHDQKKSTEENERDFNKWLLNQVEDLAKDGIIGNVHLTDNYGYQDDHLAPGQGNTPVKEVLKILKKYGYDKPLTVEPGADATTDASDVHGLMKTWRFLGAPTHGMGYDFGVGAPDRSWSQVQHSYFGRTYPPYFVFGAYSPSNDWTLWSGVPME